MVNCRKLFDTARTFMAVLLGGASDWNSNICPSYMYLAEEENCGERSRWSHLFHTKNNISVQKPSSGNLVHGVGVGDNCWWMYLGSKYLACHIKTIVKLHPIICFIGRIVICHLSLAFAHRVNNGFWLDSYYWKCCYRTKYWFARFHFYWKNKMWVTSKYFHLVWKWHNP